MNLGKCNVSIAPLRADNSDAAEMVSQILFGEIFQILEVKKDFTKVKTIFDCYEGWMDTLQIDSVPETDVDKRKINMVYEPFQTQILNDGKTILTMGSEVDFETITTKRSDNIRESIILTAKEFLNTPYLWGGRTIFGIDCSGLVQTIYKIHHLNLPRDAYQQAEIGITRDFVEEAEPGDLAFFENNEGKIVHVGIILNPYEIVHAAEKVRIDSFDFSGVYNARTKTHSHKLKFVKNILG